MRSCANLNNHEQSAQSNQDILLSIREHGILSPQNISSAISSNQTTQNNKINNSVCVNYLDLRRATAEEKTLAFETACDEEYLGIYGISTERSYPLQQATNIDLSMQEISERIRHQVVFILPPPTLSPFKGTPTAAKSSLDLAFYNHQKNDSFSQAREKSLFSGKDLTLSPRVTEIKTDTQFPIKDIIAILAPEHLFLTCQKIFANTGIEVKAVPSCQKKIVKLPAILDIYFNETLTSSFNVSVPDYAKALSEFTEQKKLAQFAIHGVRLNTPFDFTLRPIHQWQKHPHLLKLVKAKMAYEMDEDLGWFWLHKKDGSSKTTITAQLKKMLPPELFSNYIATNQASIDIFKQLISLKGEHEINILYTSMHAGQVHFLLQQGIALVKTSFFYMTFCSKDQIPLVKQVLNHFEKIENEKATPIQAHFRGHRCRNFFNRYKKAKKEMELNQAMLLEMAR